MSTSPGAHLELAGLELDVGSEREGLERMFSSLEGGSGGWAVALDLPSLRRLARSEQTRSLVRSADLRIPVGPVIRGVVRLRGVPCDADADAFELAEALASKAADRGRSVALVGGSGGEGAQLGQAWTMKYPGLRVVDAVEPWLDADPTELQLRSLGEWLRSVQPDIAFFGLGAPKDERVIHQVRHVAPATWMVALGSHFGQGPSLDRPLRAGAHAWFESIRHPRAAARRGVWSDLPFTGELVLRSAWLRLRRRIG